MQAAKVGHQPALSLTAAATENTESTLPPTTEGTNEAEENEVLEVSNPSKEETKQVTGQEEGQETILKIADLSSAEINKFSEEMIASVSSLKENDGIVAFVEVSDIDHDAVMKQFAAESPELYNVYMESKYDTDQDIPTIFGDIDAKDGNDDFSKVDTNHDILNKAIETMRDVYARAYTEHNTNLLGDMVQKGRICYLSKYSPLNIIELDRNDLLLTAKNAHVLSISVFNEEPLQDFAAIANAVTRADYVRDSYGNSGAGVKIGMIESGFPDPAYLSSSYYTVNPNVEYYTTAHAANTARLLVGPSNSIVPDAQLYCSRAYLDYDSASYNGFYSAVEWLISQGVHVINMSAGWEHGGVYHAVNAWIDRLATVYSIHFVAATGTGYEVEGVSSPAMAYNAISAGAFDENSTTTHSSHIMLDSDRSQYWEAGTSGRAEKPNLIAPGGDINTGSGITYNNTSAAATQVTGVIAQLCSYNSSLKTKQTAVGAILMASAARKINDTSSVHGNTGGSFVSSDRINGNTQISNREGAGKLDARWARGIVQYGNYWSYSLSSSSFPYSKSVTIDASANSLTRVAIFWLKREGYALTDLDLRVYNPSGQLITSSATNNSNFEIVQFVPAVSGTYRIEILRYGGASSTEHVGIAVY